MDRLKKATANVAGAAARASGASSMGDIRAHPTPAGDRRPCRRGADGLWCETTSKSSISAMSSSTRQPAALFTGSTNVRVWSADSGENTQVVEMKAKFSSVSCMHTATRVGRSSGAVVETVWCGHTDGSVTAIDGGGVHECRARFSAHRTAVTALAVIHCQGELWTGSDSGTIRSWPDLGRHGEHSAELELPGRGGGGGAAETRAVEALVYLAGSGQVRLRSLAGCCLAGCWQVKLQC